ncbi:MAG: beta-hydroxyacyl-ACP dehydratase [Pirellulaceae bacterium]
MRWFWIDRFTEFVSGVRASSVKCVSLAEEHVDEYFPGYPQMTPSFVLEGFAQTGGLLLGQVNDFQERVVLAKISSAKFHCLARPGDHLSYSVTLETIQPDGGLIKATSHLGEKLHGEAELTFAYAPDSVVQTEMFEPAEFLRMLRIYGLFDVGVDQDGKPLKIPQRFLDAEARVMT